jgi:hypothetical protein
MTSEVAKDLQPPRTLKDYCPWMHEFKAANYEKELEIPGQYTGMSKPMPEYHTKISGFDERVSRFGLAQVWQGLLPESNRLFIVH